MLCLAIPTETNHESFRDEHTGSLCRFRPLILSNRWYFSGWSALEQYQFDREFVLDGNQEVGK